jgi:hypothetical protein
MVGTATMFSLCVVCAARSAAADVSSWFSMMGGGGLLRSAALPSDVHGLMQLELGVGSSPDTRAVVGGVLKTITFFGHGTDLAVAARGATGGFARGDWGFALDAGPFQRWWGPVSSTGLLVSLSIGGPFGIQASAILEEGGNDARTVGFILGIDLMRMSVYRTSGTNWMPNPLPPAELRGAGPAPWRF